MGLNVLFLPICTAFHFMNRQTAAIFDVKVPVEVVKIGMN